MKILMFSSDPKVFEAGTAASVRMEKYREVLERLDIVRLDRSRGRFLRFWRGYREAIALLERERYDLITAQEIEHAFLAWQLSKKFGVPFEMQIHTDIFSPYFAKESFFNKLRGRLAKFLIPRASHIRVVSLRIKNSLLNASRYTRNAVSVLPIFSEVPRGEGNIKSKYPDAGFVILMVSRLTREKNIPLALRAFRNVVKKFTGTLLVIVGDGPEREYLKSLARTYHLQPNVLFEGWQNDLAPYYTGADIFLLTSNYEGFGLSAVEALSAGVPVVMTDVGIAGEIVRQGENGIVVSVGNEKRIAEALTRLIVDAELASKLRDGARRTKMPYASFGEYRDALINQWKTIARPLQ